MKLIYKMVLGLAGATMTGALTGCDDMTVRTVVVARGNNKLHLRDVDDADAHYVIDCKTFPAGGRLYRDVAPGDIIRGTYVAHQNRVYVSILPDTVARYVINYGDLPADGANITTTEDKIVREMVRANRQKQR